MNVLFEFLITRLVHDLSSPLTALSNTLDLAKMDLDFKQEADELILQSVEVLKIRLKFFRALWGLESSILPSLATDYLKTIAPKINLNGKIENRFILGLFFLGTEILGKGGKIVFNEKSCSFEGTFFRNEDEFLAILKGEQKEISLENAAAVFMAQYAQSISKKLAVSQEKQKITLIW